MNPPEDVYVMTDAAGKRWVAHGDYLRLERYALVQAGRLSEADAQAQTYREIRDLVIEASGAIPRPTAADVAEFTKPYDPDEPGIEGVDADEVAALVAAIRGDRLEDAADAAAFDEAKAADDGTRIPLDDIVRVMTPEETQRDVTELLAELGMTLDELREEARTGTFRSEDASLAWFAISGLVEG